VLGSPREVAAYFEEMRREALDRHLQAAAGALGGRGLTALTTMLEGDPSAEILALAEARQAAVIVMATHGRGGVGRWLIGSVADKVMRGARRPVLLIRPPDPEAPATPHEVNIRRVMLPLDGSALAETAIPDAAALAAALGATLTLVRVEPWMAAVVAPAGFIGDLRRLDERAADAADAYLAGVRLKLPAGVRSEAVVLRGPAAPMLIDFAQQDHVDLIVMSTHGLGGLQRVVMGSMADRLVRSGVPTMVIRPRVTAPVSKVAMPAETPAR
jgi:nucleotide-binding universal stress UspA family protein